MIQLCWYSSNLFYYKNLLIDTLPFYSLSFFFTLGELSIMEDLLRNKLFLIQMVNSIILKKDRTYL